MYAFIGVDSQALPEFDDQQFALDLLEQKHVLVAPGVSFNVPYRNHFRVTTLPDAGDAASGVRAYRGICSAAYETGGESTAMRVVDAQARFK